LPDALPGIWDLFEGRPWALRVPVIESVKTIAYWLTTSPDPDLGRKGLKRRMTIVQWTRNNDHCEIDKDVHGGAE
jgi:hypothetical protein